MIVDPLQGGIGEYDIEVAIGGGDPRCNIFRDPALRWIVAPGARDHAGGTVEAGDLGFGPAIRQQGGAIAGSAAKVDYSPNAGYRDARDQVMTWPRALFGEFEVLSGTPARHSPTVAQRDLKVPPAR
jgi:hypothetical protein